MKPCILLFILVAFFYSCASPDRKPAGPDSTGRKTDSVQAAPDSNATTKFQPPAAEYFLDEQHFSVPPFGLDKIKALIPRIKWYDDSLSEQTESDSLDQRSYDSLSFREKFTYNMIHPEGYSQMCDALPDHEREADRIYAFLPNLFGEFHWNDRQMAFFKDNRDSAVALIKETVKSQGHIGINFQDVVVDLNATELIPTLADIAHTETDNHYSLTVLMLLMKKNEYPEFMNSSSNSKLYIKASDGRKQYLVYNKGNEDLIIQRATNFYNGLAKN